MGSRPNPVFEELETPAAAAATSGPASSEQQPDPAAAAIQNQIDESTRQFVETLTTAGINPQNVNQILQNNRQFQQMLSLYQTDPVQYHRTMRQLFPDATKKFVDHVTDEFIAENLPAADEGEEEQRSAPKSRGTASEDSPAVRTLQQRLQTLENSLAEANRRSVAQQVTQLYNQNVDSAIKKVTDAANLSKRDSKSIRARVDVIMGADVNAQQRFVNGDWRDIPRVLKQVMDDWTAETESTTEGEAARRETVAASSSRSVTAGSETVGGKDTTASGKPPDDDWEVGVNDMARELLKGAAKK